MPEPRDECRIVHLPSGPIRLRSAQEPTGEALAALDEVVTAVKRMAAARPVDDGAEALWARLDAARTRNCLSLRDVAQQAGVKFSTLFRIGQGLMPTGADLARINAWLGEHDA